MNRSWPIPCAVQDGFYGETAWNTVSSGEVQWYITDGYSVVPLMLEFTQWRRKMAEAVRLGRHVPGTAF